MISPRLLRPLFWLAALGMAVLFPFMAWHGYPQSDGDTLWFLPAALAEARGEGLVNALHVNAGSFDITHRNLFVFYPPGFPWFLGKIAAHTFGATAQGIYTAFAALSSLTVLLAALPFAHWAGRRPPEQRRKGWLLALAALLALGTYGSAFAFGRPDTMATVVVLFGALAVALADREIFLLSPVLGLLAFLHPVAALFATALLGLRLSLRLTLPHVATLLIPFCLIGVGVMLLLFAVSPNGLQASFDGIRWHAGSTMVSGTWDDPHKNQPLKFLFLHSYATAYGLLVLVAAALLGEAVVRRWKEGRGTRVGIVFFTGCLAAFFFHFVAEAWDRAYNLWVFTPVTLWVILILGGRMGERMGGRTAPRLGFVLLLAVFLACASGFLHRALLFPYALADRAGSLDAAKVQAARLLGERPPGLIAVSKSLWLLFDDVEQPNPVRAFALDPAQRRDDHPAYIVLQQRFTAYETAPELPGFRKVWDDFTAEKPRFLGIALSGTAPSYRFAFYERIESAN
ncbi:4-amino-4-deoxy-L-arabinose transferase [Verrucomicrobium sp. GAS474]|uniref:hypothetical protein n=1 Tax=Verrucomicrobium sp. GAS474 TaxID=1882831 RepID=UPI00087A8057|nr:hypothetical protein [Verrucomicrobium sp. GAS474]SDT87457.1 4-amino-4-deoxy-L-arabinose transferase [Verrucomicrobium sp. GAS474]